jgi:hypothetical protein
MMKAALHPNKTFAFPSLSIAHGVIMMSYDEDELRFSGIFDSVIVSHC